MSENKTKCTKCQQCGTPIKFTQTGNEPYTAGGSIHTMASCLEIRLSSMTAERDAEKAGRIRAEHERDLSMQLDRDGEICRVRLAGEMRSEIKAGAGLVTTWMNRANDADNARLKAERELREANQRADCAERGILGMGQLIKETDERREETVAMCRQLKTELDAANQRAEAYLSKPNPGQAIIDELASLRGRCKMATKTPKRRCPKCGIENAWFLLILQAEKGKP